MKQKIEINLVFGYLMFHIFFVHWNYYETDEHTFIENCVMNFSHTSSLHWVSGVDLSHIWLDRSSLLLEWLSLAQGLILSLLGPSCKAIYKTYG